MDCAQEITCVSLLSARMRNERRGMKKKQCGIMHEFPFCVMKTFMDVLNTIQKREIVVSVSANFLHFTSHSCVCRLFKCCCQDYNIHIRSPPNPAQLCTLDEITIRFYSIFTIQFAYYRAMPPTSTHSRNIFKWIISNFFPLLHFSSFHCACVYNHL